MNFKILTKVLIVFILTLLISCNTEKKRFTELLQKQDLTLAYQFQTKYPKSTFKIDSLIQELEYKKLNTSKSIPDYIRFKTKFSNSIHNDSIQLRLYQLEWDNLKKIWSVEEVKTYLNKYPQSPYYNEAENWLYDNALAGTCIDKRDGHKYSWQKVGYQIWMKERLTYQKEYGAIDAYYNTSELTNAAPEGWRIPTIADWTQAVEFITKQTFAQVGMIDGSQFFTNACLKNSNGFTIGEWKFWALINPNSNDYTAFNLSDAHDKYQNSYYCQFSGIPNNNLLYLLCIKKSKDETNYDSNKNVKDIDGIVYRTINIGDKRLMKESISTTKFSNGDVIPTTENQTYCEEQHPVYHWSNGTIGSFYTGYAVTDVRNVCPTGWHVTSEIEWKDIVKKMGENNNGEHLIHSFINYRDCGGDNNMFGVRVACYWTPTSALIISEDNNTGNLNWHFDNTISRKHGMQVICMKN